MSAIVRKADRTLAAIPKTREVTAEMRRTFNALVFLAQQSGLQQPVHSAPVDRVLELAGYAAGDVGGLKRALSQMTGTAIEWDSPNEDSPSWTVSTLIASAEIDPDSKCLTWSYSTRLWSDLIYPTIYAAISLEDTWSLRSHASLALFEICSRYLRPGKTTSTPARSWRWWQRALIGRPVAEFLVDNDLDAFNAFKRDLLDAAIEEVKRGGDLCLEMSEVPDHQRGALIAFVVRQSTAPNDLIEAEQPGSRAHELTATVPPAPSHDDANGHHGIMHDDMREPSRAPISSPFQFVADSCRPKPGDLAWGSAVAKIAAMMPSDLSEFLERFERDLQRRNAHPSIARRLRSDGWRHQMVLQSVVDFFDRERAEGLSESR